MVKTMVSGRDFPSIQWLDASGFSHLWKFLHHFYDHFVILVSPHSCRCCWPWAFAVPRPSSRWSTVARALGPKARRRRWRCSESPRNLRHLRPPRPRKGWKNDGKTMEKNAKQSKTPDFLGKLQKFSHNIGKTMKKPCFFRNMVEKTWENMFLGWNCCEKCEHGLEMAWKMVEIREKNMKNTCVFRDLWEPWKLW